PCRWSSRAKAVSLPSGGVHISSSSSTRAAGSTTTPRSSCSCACARRSAWSRPGSGSAAAPTPRTRSRPNNNLRSSACSGEVDTGSPTRTCANYALSEFAVAAWPGRGYDLPYVLRAEEIMAALTAAEHKVLEWIAGERAAILDLIEALVNTDSGSFDKAGVDAAGERIRAFLAARGIATDTIANDKYGDGIRATVGEGGAKSTILLMGHRDTVYGKGEAAQRPFRVADGRGSGPGCCDMKAGLAMNAIVLAAFKQFGPPGPMVALFTADEEIGSLPPRTPVSQEG